jgi:hypothetical protein
VLTIQSNTPYAASFCNDSIAALTTKLAFFDRCVDR